MWFDVTAALAAIEGEAATRPPATSATPATRPPRVAEVASVATPAAPKNEPVPPEAPARVAEVANVARPRAAAQETTQGASDRLGTYRYARGWPGLPRVPPVCAGCGVADRTVSLTNPDGRTFHVACGMKPNRERNGR
jgi:hypothetical protein